MLANRGQEDSTILQVHPGGMYLQFTLQIQRECLLLFHHDYLNNTLFHRGLKMHLTDYKNFKKTKVIVSC